MKKIIFSILLCIVGILNSYAELGCGTCGTNLTWSLSDEGVLTISGSGDMKGYTYDTDNGVYRTSAPWGTYYKQIKSLVVGEGVTSIGTHAFYGCSSLSSIGDLSACTSIGSYAFIGCKSLSSIGDLSACKSIGSDALNGCSSLSSIGDLSACTSIGEKAFYGCSSLSSIGDLSACTSIGRYAFAGCKSLSSIGDLSACTSISSSAFAGCSNLSSIGDLSACKSIGSDALNGCSSLSSIGDLSACTSIGEKAFYGCSSLSSIGDLSACTSISSSAFAGCSNLSSIGDLSACTNIGSYAFSSCTLPKITIGEATTLGSTGTIPECMTVLVPADKVEIYRTAEKWSSLAQRIISKDAQNDFDIEITATPTTGSAIQNAVEALNGDLANVISLKVTGDINAYDIFVMRNKMPNLHIIDLSDANIKATEDSYKYYSSYTTSDNVFPIYAFDSQTKLVDVKLPKSITSIGNIALSGCSNIVAAELFAGVEDIGNNAFRGCTNLRELVIPEGCISIGESAFYNCTNLKNLTLPTTLTIIKKQAFEYCSSLSSVALPSSLSRIESEAFSDCSSLTEISLPSALSYIDYRAFYGCSSLTEISLPSALSYIGVYAFFGCSNLKTVKASALDPESVTMSDNSFEGYANKTLYVPYDGETGWDATYYAYYWNTQWGQFGAIEKWKPTYDYVSIDKDYDHDKGTIPGEDINADMNQQSGYILGDAASQHFDKVHIKHNGSTGGSIVTNGTLNINKLFNDITITANKWHFFCFPFNVNLSDLTYDGNYVWYEYDGDARSKGNNGWKKLGNETTQLTAGKGYIFQANKSFTLSIPVNNPTVPKTDKSKDLETHTAANAQNASWNFTGNPYLSYYNMDKMDFDAPITVWNGSNYQSVRPGDDDYQFQPYQAFFVQKPEGTTNVSFGKDGRETYTQSVKVQSQAKARRAKAKKDSNRQLVNLVVSDGENTDMTRVVFNNEKSKDYEIGCDASKFFSTEAIPQIYTVYNNVNYSINERPNAEGAVQLAFKAAKAGTYTIKAERMDTPMLIKDNQTSMTFDLVNGEYSFKSEAGTFASRFTLIKSENATAIKGTEATDADKVVTYDISGKKVEKAQKGVYIQNGKKVLVNM